MLRDTRRNAGARCRKCRMGKTQTEEVKHKISESLGKTHTDERRRKVSEKAVGRTVTEETRRKLSESLTRYWAQRRALLYNPPTNHNNQGKDYVPKPTRRFHSSPAGVGAHSATSPKPMNTATRETTNTRLTALYPLWENAQRSGLPIAELQAAYDDTQSGKVSINRSAKELGVPYPTLRGWLLVG